LREKNSSSVPIILLHALPIATLVIYLVIRWFVLADRYRVFLYFHDMGPAMPDTTPFSPVTSSRYWMAGSVAAGAVLVLYAAANWLWGLRNPSYQPPPWWQVWLPCAAVLLIAIPAITMTANNPVLPLTNAIQVTLATLGGLALALLPGNLAARRPVRLLLLAADGLGLMPLLFLGTMLAFLKRWLAGGGSPYPMLILPAGLVFTLFSALLTSGVYRRRRIESPTISVYLAAGLNVNYLFMPLLHHIGFTDGYFYITDSDNFFARNLLFQAPAWLITSGAAWAITQLRLRFVGRPQLEPNLWKS